MFPILRFFCFGPVHEVLRLWAILWLAPASKVLNQAAVVCTLSTAIGCNAVQPTPQPLALKVNTGDILREHVDQWIGINLNYLRDSNVNRPSTPTTQPLSAALTDMGVRWLRYPGGEKSDFHLFAPPPYEKPAPISLKWYAGVPGERLDIDAYIRLCRQVGAEPFVVVGCDSEKRTGRTWDQWLEHAVALVRYANKTKGYTIRHWEIGNENWNNQTADPKAMADIVVRFAEAMKQVDPKILVGASVTETDDWCRNFLPTAAPHLDFITESVYNAWGWGSYNYWPAHSDVDLISGPNEVLHQLDQYATPADRERIKLIVTETNSRDYSKNGWKAENNIGHALVTFETFGEMMREARIESAMFWTTRWIKDSEATQSQWYALDPTNHLLPVGQSVALWGRYLKTNLVATEGSTASLKIHASASGDNSELTVWVVNVGLTGQDNVRLLLDSTTGYQTVQTCRLSGKTPDDRNVKWEQFPPAKVETVSGSAPLTFPPLSVTIFSFKK